MNEANELRIKDMFTSLKKMKLSNKLLLAGLAVLLLCMLAITIVLRCHLLS